MTLNDAYRILGLGKDAGPAEVKAAYRRRIAEAHPDRGGEAAQFIKIRAAYEILIAFLQEGRPEDDVAIPDELREVIDGIVRDFREQSARAEAEALRRMDAFERHTSTYLSSASRSELRQFSSVLRTSWNANLRALFEYCNEECDSIVQEYESWYTESTQTVFDDIYRRELLSFPLRRRFWEIFVVIAAFAGALTVVVGWSGTDRWWSIGIMVAALVASFLGYRWWCRRQRRNREAVEPLSVAPFEWLEGTRFQAETKLRRARSGQAAMSVAGLFMGTAATGGLAIPIIGAAAGAALGGVFDRLLNPTERVREDMQRDLIRFMAMARPQVTVYVLRAHQTLMADVQGQILTNYEERVKGTVKLLAAGSEAPPPRRRRAAQSGRSEPMADA